SRYNTHSCACGLHQPGFAVARIEITDGSIGLLGGQSARYSQYHDGSEFSPCVRLPRYKLQTGYSSIDEIVIVNGNGDTLAMLSVFNPQDTACAANTDRFSERDFVGQGHDKLNRGALSEFVVHIHKHPARAYVAALRGHFCGAVPRVRDGNGQLKKKTPGGTLLRLRLRHTWGLHNCHLNCGCLRIVAQQRKISSRYSSSQEGCGLEGEKILEQQAAGFSEHAFRVKLDAFHGVTAVPQPHNYARAIVFAGFGADFKIRGQALFGDDERVVAGGRQRLGRTAKEGSAIVLDFADLAMHHLRRAHNLAPEGGADGLVSQADTQNRLLAGKMANQFNADAGFMRRTWAGRNQDVAGIESFNIPDGNLVIAAHLNGLTHLAEILHQVVGEGIVVVEDEDHAELV